MALYKRVDGVRILMTVQEEADMVAEWAANQVTQDAKQAIEDALEAQKLADRVSMLTWEQIRIAINNAFPDSAQASIVRKLARALYTVVKGSVL